MDSDEGGSYFSSGCLALLLDSELHHIPCECQVRSLEVAFWAASYVPVAAQEARG